MRISFRHVNVDCLTNLWNRQCPEKYHIDPEVFRLNTVDCPTFDWGASGIEVDDEGHALGFVAVKKSSGLLYKGPDPDQAHLSAIIFDDCMMGVDLLKETKALLRNRGVQKLAFGQDTNHFFPGCPRECHQLHDFLTVEGFQEGPEIVDLVSDVQQYSSPKGVNLLPKTGSTAVRRLTNEDQASFERYIEETFPGRWAYDIQSKVHAESGLHFVAGLIVDGEVKGHAMLQDETHQAPVCGAVWRNALGNNWCALGSIGISNDVRGKGLGDALLASSLNILKEEGRRNCIIDWTNLVGWYEKHGFVVTNTYRQFVLNLNEASEHEAKIL